MDDDAVLSQINDLVAEEHSLLESSRAGEGLDTQQEARLKTVEVALDQCWDLLRQRRASRHAGRDPEDAHVRDATTVEGYQQ
ncbi:MAG: hypothetical protein QOJ23_4504 [Actinomycetota bacterium]|jgi:hypothetical protein|nr:hypothetical protein [Actinomycetota bacterium]MDQ1501229.1 hypothetical protein [Actinomycetota bacterium]